MNKKTILAWVIAAALAFTAGFAGVIGLKIAVGIVAVLFFLAGAIPDDKGQDFEEKKVVAHFLVVGDAFPKNEKPFSGFEKKPVAKKKVTKKAVKKTIKK